MSAVSCPPLSAGVRMATGDGAGVEADEAAGIASAMDSGLGAEDEVS